MENNTSKIAVALLCSTLLLSGCLKNENGDSKPPVNETPEETPDENPDAEEPLDPEIPDDGNIEDPDSDVPEGPESPDGPIDGELTQPYAQGVQVYQILDSTALNAEMIRESRDITGGTVVHNRQIKTSSEGVWEDNNEGQAWRILSDNSTDTNFLVADPEAYDLDTSQYNISINNTPFNASIEHRYYDTTGQSIYDFVEVNVKAPNLANSLNTTVNFDGEVQVYEENMSLENPFVAYYPGPSDSSGGGCLDASGAPINETISTSGNCNVVVDGNGDAHGTLDAMISLDESSAPIVSPNTILEKDLKLIADDDSFAFGNVIDAETGGPVARFSKETFMDGTEYLALSSLDTNTMPYYNVDDIEWNTIASHYFVRDNQRIRMAVEISGNSTLKNSGFLVNEAGIEQIDAAFNWQ